MLFVNSIILGVIGLIITSSNSQQALWLLPSLASMGLFLCSIWFLFMRRETEYANYYIKSARELEEKHLSNTVKTVSRGAVFSDGGEVTLEIGNAPIQLRMSWLARLIRARSAATVVVFVLGFLYIATIILHLAGFHPFA